MALIILFEACVGLCYRVERKGVRGKHKGTVNAIVVLPGSGRSQFPTLGSLGDVKIAN